MGFVMDDTLKVGAILLVAYTTLGWCVRFMAQQYAKLEAESNQRMKEANDRERAYADRSLIALEDNTKVLSRICEILIRVENYNEVRNGDKK